MQDIPRQLLYQDKKGYGEIFNNDPTGVNNFLVQICQMLISKCNLNGSCVDLVKIINESFYYSIKINQQPGVFSDDVNEVLKSELMEHVGSQEKVLITKVLIYLLLSLSNDSSEESQKVLEELGKKLKREVPTYSDFSAYGFFEWVKTERKKVSFTVDLSPRPRRVSELEDHEIYELTDKFSSDRILYVVDLYESEEDKADAIAAIENCLCRYKEKQTLSERHFSELKSFLGTLSSKEPEVEELNTAIESENQIAEQNRIIEELREQLKENEKILESRNKSIQQLQSKVSGLETEIEMFRNSAQQSENDYKALGEEMARVNEENARLKSLLAQLDQADNAKRILSDDYAKSELTSAIADRTIPLIPLICTAQHWGDRKQANIFDLFIRRALGKNITAEDIILLDQIDEYYSEETEGEKKQKKDILETMKEILARPTTQNLVYPQADSTTNVGCDQKQSEFKTFLPPASEVQGQIGSQKNEQKNLT